MPIFFSASLLSSSPSYSAGGTEKAITRIEPLKGFLDQSIPLLKIEFHNDVIRNSV